MKGNGEPRLTLVEGPDTAANEQAIGLLQSLPGCVIERVAGFPAMGEWVETPCVRIPEGYVVSGLEHIRQFVDRARLG